MTTFTDEADEVYLERVVGFLVRVLVVAGLGAVANDVVSGTRLQVLFGVPHQEFDEFIVHWLGEEAFVLFPLF